jgi:hypothetical protein
MGKGNRGRDRGERTDDRGRRGRRVLSLYPFLDEPVDFFSVNYTKDENSAIQSFKNHPVISNSQLPVSFKGSL